MDYAKEGHANDQKLITGIAELKELYQEVKKEITAFTFHIRMGTEDVSRFFPANDNDMILKFMEQDGEFESRRHGFYELLKTTVSTTQKKFTDSLINTLFTVNYKGHHRWPCAR